MNMSWVILGDLNLTLYFSEKQSLSTHSAPSFQIVHDTIHMHGLRDVPFTGNPFTWSNHRKNQHLVKTRIDRALANNEWFIMYKDSIINNLLPHGSYHAPILLHTHLPEKK